MPTQVVQVQRIDCPHCGHVFGLPFTHMERQVLLAMQRLTRHASRVTTRAVSMELFLSSSQANRYLRRLAQRGVIGRIGQKGGWYLPKGATLIAIPKPTTKRRRAA